MSGPHLLCFDLDGTLEDSRRDMTLAVQRVRADLGLSERSDGDIRPHVNKGMRKLYEICFDDHLDGQGPGEERYDDVKKRYEADYLKHIDENTRLYDGIQSALQELAALGRLAVVTNKPEHLSRALIAALGIAGLFDEVVGGDTCAEPKPSPLPFQHAAKKLGFDEDRGHAFMIGDTAGDMKTGAAAGATRIWCAWGYVDQPGEETPDLTANTPQELPAVVKGFLERRQA